LTPPQRIIFLDLCGGRAEFHKRIDELRVRRSYVPAK